MKYKLKKDLPFAKKGSLIDRMEYGNLNFSPQRTCFIEVNNKIYDLPTDSVFDWIEEVKPREFFIGIDEKVIFGAWEIENTHEAKKYSFCDEVIKVREVIE